MNKKIIINKAIITTIIILFITINVVPSTAIQEPIKKSSPLRFDGNTLYVGGSGPDNYTKIQDAIDDAVDGDTVFVYDDSSPYNESIVVNKRIDLIGENRDTTIITDNHTRRVILSSNYSTISGFYIMGSGIGVEIKANNVTIADNNIDVNKAGISLLQDYPSYEEYQDAIISNNNIKAVRQGIYIEDSRANIIINNNITRHVLGGISIARSGDNLISGNIINNVYGDFFYFGDIYLVHVHNTKILNNILIGVNGRSPDGIQFDGGCDNNVIANNSISGYDHYGIWIRAGSSNTIYRNSFIENKRAIFLENSGLNEIYQNNFNDNTKNAKFIFFSFRNNWDANYWDEPRDSPYLIIGRLGLLFIPWINVDWNPAQDPYAD